MRADKSHKSMVFMVRRGGWNSVSAPLAQCKHCLLFQNYASIIGHALLLGYPRDKYGSPALSLKAISLAKYFMFVINRSIFNPLLTLWHPIRFA